MDSAAKKFVKTVFELKNEIQKTEPPLLDLFFNFISVKEGKTGTDSESGSGLSEISRSPVWILDIYDRLFSRSRNNFEYSGSFFRQVKGQIEVEILKVKMLRKLLAFSTSFILLCVNSFLLSALLSGETVSGVELVVLTVSTVLIGIFAVLLANLDEKETDFRDCLLLIELKTRGLTNLDENKEENLRDCLFSIEMKTGGGEFSDGSS